jgi:hypothetical protein
MALFGKVHAAFVYGVGAYLDRGNALLQPVQQRAHANLYAC